MAKSQLDLERAHAQARRRASTSPLMIHSGDRNGSSKAADTDPERAYNGEWYGVRGFFKWLEARSYKMHVRIFLSRFRAYTSAHGLRWRSFEEGGATTSASAAHHGRSLVLPVSDLLRVVNPGPPRRRSCRTMLRDEIASPQLPRPRRPRLI
jgi:excinuclease ABC subunit A